MYEGYFSNCSVLLLLDPTLATSCWSRVLSYYVGMCLSGMCFDSKLALTAMYIAGQGCGCECGCKGVEFM